MGRRVRCSEWFEHLVPERLCPTCRGSGGNAEVLCGACNASGMQRLPGPPQMVAQCCLRADHGGFHQVGNDHAGLGAPGRWSSLAWNTQPMSVRVVEPPPCDEPDPADWWKT